MLIELLIVGAIVGYLYTVGFVSFDSPYGMAISIAVVFIVFGVSWTITHFIARSFVDSLFGFSSWSPRSAPAKRKSLVLERGGDNAQVVLERLVREQPADGEISRQLSELYLKNQMFDNFISERQRFLGTASVSVQEAATIYHRMADVELRRGNQEEAIAHLRTFTGRWPDSAEAGNARRRIETIAAAMQAAPEPESA